MKETNIKKSTEEANKALADFSNLEIFNKLDIEFFKTGYKKSGIRLIAKEKSKGPQLTLNGGYELGKNKGITGSLNFKMINLFGKAESMEVSLSSNVSNEKSSEFNLNLKKPFFFNNSLHSIKGLLFHKHKENIQGLSISWLTSLIKEKPLYEIKLGYEKSKGISSILSAELDFRDRIDIPQNGTFQRIETEFCSRGFLRTEIRAQKIFNLKKIFFALSGHGGFIRGNTIDSDLLVVGGPLPIRGLKGSLGSIQDESIGIKEYAIATALLSFPIKQLHGHIFGTISYPACISAGIGVAIPIGGGRLELNLSEIFGNLPSNRFSFSFTKDLL